MVKALLKGSTVVLDISHFDKKYIGDEIKYTIYYGSEATVSGGNDLYHQVASLAQIYNGEKEIRIELPEVKRTYKGRDIEICYYGEIYFGKKFLVLSDKKEFDITPSSEYLLEFPGENITKSGKFRNIGKDSYSFKLVLKNIWETRKKWVVGYLLGIPLLGIFVFPLLFFYLPIGFAILWFIGGKKIMDVELNVDIKEGMKVAEIIRGTVNLSLEQGTIQLFALNSEAGSYDYDCGSSTCTAYFDKEFANVCLYEKEFSNISAVTDLADIITGNISLQQLHNSLLPSIPIGESEGLYLSLELRVFSKNYKDIIFRKRLTLPEEDFINKQKKELPNESEEKFNSDFFT